MAYVKEPVRDMLFIPPAWTSRQAKRNGAMFAYDASYAESRKARDAEPVAEPGNTDAINEIVRWNGQNLSPDEIVELYNQIGKLDATGPSDQSKNDRNEEMGMQEAESEDEPPPFYGKPSPGGTMNTSQTRREPPQGAPARSGGLPASQADRNRAMDMAIDEVFADGKRIGLRALGWPANPSQTRVAFESQSAADFEKLFPDAKRLRV
jgi:hypothetical protein